MAEITLLRHGQASFGADNYDRLSATGHQQSLWLGQHLKSLGENFDRVVLGTMVRHRETAQGVMTGLGQDLPLETDAGLNEYDFQGLLTPFQHQYPAQWQATQHNRRDYFHNMKWALTYWMAGDIATDGRDSWRTFCARIHAAFQASHESAAKRTLVVTSGGPIAVILAAILGLDHKRTCNLTLQIKNSSTSKFLYRNPSSPLDDFTLDSFNAVSHLLSEDKRHSITFS